MLVYDGFKYVVNRQSQRNTFWRCNRYVKYGCRAGAVTSKGDAKDQTIRLTHVHSHPREKIDYEYHYKNEEFFETRKYEDPSEQERSTEDS